MHWFDRVAAELAAEHRVIRVDPARPQLYQRSDQP
jgi:hypothetical protein